MYTSGVTRGLGSDVISRCLARGCLAGLLLLCACGPSPPAPPGNTLIAGLRPGPATWFTSSSDQSSGIDYELAQTFARQHKLKLEAVAADDPEQLLRDPDSRAQLAGGGVYHSASPEAAADGL